MMFRKAYREQLKLVDLDENANATRNFLKRMVYRDIC